MNLDLFYKGLSSNIEGEIILANLDRDTKKNRFISSSTCPDFLIEITNSTSTSPKEVFHQVRPSFCRMGHQLYYSGVLVRVMSMYNYAIRIGQIETDPESIAYYFGEFSEDGEPLNGGSIGGDVTWVTKYEDLKTVFNNLPAVSNVIDGKVIKIADEIRNVLGLTSEEYNPRGGVPVLLVWIGYHEGLPAPYSLHNPTVFDADGHWIWRSNGTNNEWGMTVHLISFNNEKPEAVHKGFIIELSHQMKVHPLGCVQNKFDSATVDKNILKTMII